MITEGVFTLVIGVLSLLPFGVSAAEDADTPTAPPWLTTEVIEAAYAIRLTREQMPHFTSAVSQCISEYDGALRRIIFQTGGNLEFQFRSAWAAAESDMDASLRPLLTPEPWPRYETYKVALRDSVRTVVDAGVGQIEKRF